VSAPAAEARIRVLVADDHLVVRYGLVSIVNQQEDMTVVAEAANGPQVVELWKAHRPDVTLMDLRMPGMGGVEAIEAIRKDEPQARVIVLTIHKGDEAVYRAIRAGARGYLPKDVALAELVSAIRSVHAGRRAIPAEVAERMAQRYQYTELSSRELTVLKLAAGGLGNKEIGDRLELSESAVKHHVGVVLSKLSAHDRAHAVALALDRGLLDLEDLELHE
jgi:two-component system, NarL family, response regulator